MILELGFALKKIFIFSSSKRIGVKSMKKNLEGSLGIKIITTITILFALDLLLTTGYNFYRVMSVSTTDELLIFIMHVSMYVLIPRLLGLLFLVSGLGLWKHHGWSLFLLMIASIGQLCFTFFSSIIYRKVPSLLSLDVLLPVIIVVYLWFRRDTFR